MVEVNFHHFMTHPNSKIIVSLKVCDVKWWIANWWIFPGVGISKGKVITNTNSKQYEMCSV